MQGFKQLSKNFNGVMLVKIIKMRIILIWDHSLRTYKMFRKSNISYPLIRTRTFACQGIKNLSFSEDFVYVLNDDPYPS